MDDLPAPIEAVPLTKEDIRRAIFAAGSFKAPGLDGLPGVVWKELWEVLQDHLLDLFQASLDQAFVPRAWRTTKIITLRNGGAGRTYRNSNAYRPISLLPTLGKVMESILAERLSYLVEEHDLLPKHHYGARKQRSTVQATLLVAQRYSTHGERIKCCL
jgi:hypothetical protein